MPTIKSEVLVNHLTNTPMVKWPHQKFHCCIWGIIKLHMSNKIWSNVASSEKLGGLHHFRRPTFRIATK